MLELLNTFRQGSSYDGALDKVYGFDMDVLDTLWRDYVTAQLSQNSRVPSTNWNISYAGLVSENGRGDELSEEIIYHS